MKCIRAVVGGWRRDCGWGVGEGLWLGSGGGTVVGEWGRDCGCVHYTDHSESRGHVVLLFYVICRE